MDRYLRKRQAESSRSDSEVASDTSDSDIEEIVRKRKKPKVTY